MTFIFTSGWSLESPGAGRREVVLICKMVSQTPKFICSLRLSPNIGFLSVFDNSAESGNFLGLEICLKRKMSF